MNDQIREDWTSGKWTVEELSSFWGMKPIRISMIIRGADVARTPARQVADRL